MRTIWADLNARTQDDFIRLNTRGSTKSLERVGAKSGEWIWLCDGELMVGAVLREKADGLAAKPAWETIQEHSEAESAPEEVVQAALRRLSAEMKSPDRNYRLILQQLSLLEKRLGSARVNYLRARAVEALGYPELALLALEDAIAAEPDNPRYIYQELEVTSRIDLDRAVEKADELLRSKSQTLSVFVLAAVVRILQQMAARESGESADKYYRQIVDLTRDVSSLPDSETAPPSTFSLIHTVRGYAHLHLGNREEAIAAFGDAIADDPLNADPRAARGFETYPSLESIEDLKQAIHLGSLSFWPPYFLAHYYAKENQFARALEYCSMAQTFPLPNDVAANILEWRAISAYLLGEGQVEVRKLFEKALELSPQSARLRANFEAFHARADVENLGIDAKQADLVVERDANPTILDLAA